MMANAYHSLSAVVFITSNYIGNSEIMQGCKEAGIPAFGTLWDFVGVILIFLFAVCWLS
jgi:heme/copper-type cytochrome/quinol oxidase subunit 3